MRNALALICLLIAGTAHADPVEDFQACLIGYSAMALDDGVKGADAALSQAYDHCSLSADLNEIDVDAIAAYARLMVERMAAE